GRCASAAGNRADKGMHPTLGIACDDGLGATPFRGPVQRSRDQSIRPDAYCLDSYVSSPSPPSVPPRLLRSVPEACMPPGSSPVHARTVPPGCLSCRPPILAPQAIAAAAHWSGTSHDGLTS